MEILYTLTCSFDSAMTIFSSGVSVRRWEEALVASPSPCSPSPPTLCPMKDRIFTCAVSCASMKFVRMYTARFWFLEVIASPNLRAYGNQFK